MTEERRGGSTPHLASAARPDFLDLTALVVVLFVARSLSVGLLGNLQILATTMSTIGIVAAGQTLVVITGSIDSSVGSLVALTGVITADISSRRCADARSISPDSRRRRRAGHRDGHRLVPGHAHWPFPPDSVLSSLSVA